MTGHPNGGPQSSPRSGEAAEDPAPRGAARPGSGDLDELIRQTIDPLQLMQRVADQLVATVGPADGALVGLSIDEETVRFVCGSGYLGGFVGGSVPIEGSLTGRTVRTGRTHVTHDTESDDRVHRRSTRAFNVRSSICVPLGRDGDWIGVLNVCSAEPGVFGEHDLALLGGLAEFISTVIAAATDLMAITARLCGLRRGNPAAPESTGAVAGGGRRDPALTGRFVANVLDPAGAARMAARERIERIIAEHGYSLVFQPIFDLHRGGVFAVEALARFPGEPPTPPDVLLSQAHELGLGVELEAALVRAAVAHLRLLPPRAVLALNAGPEVLASGRVAEELAGVKPSRIVVELTEHVRVDNYPRLAAALRGLRGSGVRLAIDDAGAGFASLMHILALAPDFIKLDRGLISGIDLDPVRRSLASSLMRFAEETSAMIVAEGVETCAELAALDDLGIRHAQGFYLARPAPIEEISSIGRRGRARVQRQTRGVPLHAERSARTAPLRA